MTPTILTLPMYHHQPTMNYHHHMGRQTRRTINIFIPNKTTTKRHDTYLVNFDLILFYVLHIYTQEKIYLLMLSCLE